MGSKIRKEKHELINHILLDTTTIGRNRSNRAGILGTLAEGECACHTGVVRDHRDKNPETELVMTPAEEIVKVVESQSDDQIVLLHRQLRQPSHCGLEAFAKFLTRDLIEGEYHKRNLKP